MTFEVQNGDEEEWGREQKDEKYENRQKGVRLCKKAVIQKYYKANIAVTSDTSALIVIEYKLDPRSRFRVANGVADVKPNQHL